MVVGLVGLNGPIVPSPVGAEGDRGGGYVTIPFLKTAGEIALVTRTRFRNVTLKSVRMPVGPTRVLVTWSVPQTRM